MTNSVPYCSEITTNEGEPLAGSAWTAKQYIFISWSKKFWTRNQFDSQGFPPSLKVYLQTLQKERRIVTRLIHQHGNDRGGLSTLFVMPDGVEYRDVAIQDIEVLLRGHFNDIGVRDHQKYFQERTILFCCTHGKRDRCCAKFGQLTIYELQRLAKLRKLEIDVWECTHINADRFAVNAIVFPHGYMYGRIRVENVKNILDDLAAGYPFPPCFRGQVGLTPIEQIANAFGHSFRYESGIKNVEVVVESAYQKSDIEANASVVIRSRESPDEAVRFAVTMKMSNFLTYMDCDGVEANRKKSVSRWALSKSELIS
jgi:hypothetical protein